MGCGRPIRMEPLCLSLGIRFFSPAMTSISDRQTFLDEALFDLFPDRANELVHKFGAGWKALLLLAITRELGHAVCHDRAETRAEFFAEELRERRPGRCEYALASPARIYPSTYPGRQ